MTKFKGLLFDKDGTLFDFAHTWEAWAASFLMRLCEGDQVQAALVGTEIGFDFHRRKFDPNSIVIAGTQQEVTQAFLPHFPHLTEHVLSELLNDEAADAPQVEAVPLVPLLGGFRAQGIKLGVATNDAERPARVHLESVGITALFDFIVGSDSGFGGKPAPGQMFAFAEAMQLAPHEVVMIGDSTHDLHAGRAAGMATVGVMTGLAEHAELAPFADVILPDIGHLPGWLAG